MTISVHPAVAADAEVLADLMDELDSFYGDPPTEPREKRTKQIRRLLFGTPPVAYVLLARDEGRVVGMASYSYLWPAAGVTHSLYLKELYVRQDARRRGVGRVVMERLQTIAAEQGCSRVEWTTDQENVEAKMFYEALGAPAYEGKTFYRAGVK